MSQPVRRLNAEGITRFREHLGRMRADPALGPPQELLTDGLFTEIIPGGPTVEQRALPTKRSAAEYLSELFPPASNPRIETDTGLWSWLALHFFDQICPPKGSRRTLRADPHYILAADHRRRYRHLLVTPYRILASMPDHNRIFLDGPLSIHGEIIEQTISKLYMFRLPGVRATIDRLYYDEDRGRPKPGIFPTKNPRRGDLRNRFPVRIRQLQMTYDVAAIDATQLIDLLGSEFANYVPTAPA